MTAAVAPMVAVPGGSDEPADRAAPLDTLLVFADVVSGVLRRPHDVPVCGTVWRLWFP